MNSFQFTVFSFQKKASRMLSLKTENRKLKTVNL
jgi:hypothetical protein